MYFALKHLCTYFNIKQKNGCHVFYITWKATFQCKFYKRRSTKGTYIKYWYRSIMWQYLIKPYLKNLVILVSTLYCCILICEILKLLLLQTDLYIYVYIHICIHIYTHIYIQIYIHTYIHTHVLYIGLWTFGKIIWKYVWSKYSSESKNAFISGAWWSPHNWLILLTINAVTIYRYPKIWHCVLGRILCQAYFNSLYTLQWWFI